MQRGLRDKSKRGSTTAQADNFAGAKLGKKRRRATLGGCDFFVFRPKVTLKTISLEAKKSPFCNLVTSSRNDRLGLLGSWVAKIMEKARAGRASFGVARCGMGLVALSCVGVAGFAQAPEGPIPPKPGVEVQQAPPEQRARLKVRVALVNTPVTVRDA